MTATLPLPLLISQYLGDDVKWAGWINEKGFHKLPVLIKDILIVWQWFAYYNYEGDSVEQSLTGEVIEIIDSKFDLKDFAKDLRLLKNMVDEFYVKYPYDNQNLERSINLRNQLISSTEYRRLEGEVDKNEDLVMKRAKQYLFDNAIEINDQIKKIT